ncbi:21447_t:CDS:2 [Dentiscutata erythropus]|uniref:21447_t:CDS:1 n=1 Tax=Dentiscutata erythropus TaxID=1348616 RepID=A0A9N8VZZ7_9GLOM|nr:21447_t:CDS:2 [Dentiscutata erythropus]
MDFFERLKILASKAAAVYHEMEVVEESTDTDQVNACRVKTPYDNRYAYAETEVEQDDNTEVENSNEPIQIEDELKERGSINEVFHNNNEESNEVI